PALYPTTLRYLELLGAPLRAFPLTVTLYDTRTGGTLLLPPLRRGRVGWSAFRPRNLRQLVAFRRLLEHTPTGAGPEGDRFSLEEVLGGAGASRSMLEEIFYPIALSGWCVELDEFRHYSAYNVMSYLQASIPPGITPSAWVEVSGGMRAYFAAAAAQMPRASLRLDAGVACVRRARGAYEIVTERGEVAECDHVVLATNAREAARLVGEVEEAEQLRGMLGSLRYMTTRIAIHGDRRLMPPERADWSVVNTRFDGSHSHNTMWKSWRQPAGADLFKSWVTFLPEAPAPLYAERAFEHALTDRRYYEVQRELAALQGLGGIWVCGVYTRDIDSHESAITSGLAVAQRLAPTSARLARLRQTT
ncbi:MAG TPA: FAD-dependent oxidoreductase, partial [Acidimicrobiales bacterium]|nr:FAD-dependent oxidoreductase [Acidimicrobiales bacterium]